MALRVSAASARPVKPLDDDVPRFNYRPRPAARLTQAEKAAESRRRVLDAALSCLIDRGYSNTSTQEIASRAGLSRGSQLYHFPKKDALLTGAVEYLIELRIADFKETVARLPKGADLWTAAIAAFWDAWNGPLFFAWLELAVAARTDAALRKSVGALNKRTNDYLHRALQQIFKPLPEVRERFELLSWTIFFIFGSMALERSIGEFDRVADVLQVIESLGRNLGAPAKIALRKQK
ncbi:MAG TPA: TetR/AcrR family transcriptional regulator [Candidatus Binataceae bacterium]|nr:TetR/AcrR family transcriptional regulator [Candidatus Binataceae bacterium]